MSSVLHGNNRPVLHGRRRAEFVGEWIELRQVGETRLLSTSSSNSLGCKQETVSKKAPSSENEIHICYCCCCVLVVHTLHSRRKVRSPLLMGDTISTTSSFSLSVALTKSLLINLFYFFLWRRCQEGAYITLSLLSLSLSPAYPSVE